MAPQAAERARLLRHETEAGRSIDPLAELEAFERAGVARAAWRHTAEDPVEAALLRREAGVSLVAFRHAALPVRHAGTARVVPHAAEELGRDVTPLRSAARRSACEVTRHVAAVGGCAPFEAQGACDVAGLTCEKVHAAADVEPGRDWQAPCYARRSFTAGKGASKSAIRLAFEEVILTRVAWRTSYNAELTCFRVCAISCGVV
mmetsp:Transcript_62464/g.146634  ORF Transcript_62464/g.146634 Transcript_62464/m.146634 type:complete len:204 (+) Transcript_62464:432-1043(+)